MNPKLYFLFMCSLVFCKYQVKHSTQTQYTWQILLEETSPEITYRLQSNLIIKTLTFTFICLTDRDFTFKITGSNRWEVPQYNPFPKDPLSESRFQCAKANYVFGYETKPFHFKVSRKLDSEILFDSSKDDFIYSNRYLQISTVVASRIVYGLGERFSDSFRLKPGTFTIFNRDRPFVIDRGSGGQQTYGYYPVHLARQKSGNFHLAYFRSSNAMDVEIKLFNEKDYIFTYKVIGGIIDFRFYVGQLQPQPLINRFQTLSGSSTIPPFWSFGFHQCRWGYKTIDQLNKVIEGYQKNGLPLDTIWTDIDYMIDYEDFTIDERRFPLEAMNKILEKYHYVPIIDAGIKLNNGHAYTTGNRMNVFLKDANGNNLQGYVWPGNTVFVDFFTPNSTEYWGKMLDVLYNKVKFSGVWLDMNQIANFCTGVCRRSQTRNKFDYGQDLPYTPGQSNIQFGTVSLNASHYGGISESDVHIYFGFLQTKATYQFLRNKHLRPFILSRSTTIGSNKYGFHWTGDNVANFQFLRLSIAHNFLFQFWSINMVGADICGFDQNTNSQLCSRWMQLGCLYPFARNHNKLESIDQEPYALGPSVLETSKVNLKLRYSILKFYYNHFISRKGFGTIFKPLFIDFPSDQMTYQDEISQTQFIIGYQLMSAPVVRESVSTRNVYFPEVGWYDYHNGKRYEGNTTNQIQNNYTDPVPLFLRQGTGIFTQDTENVTKTNELKNVFQLRVAFKIRPDLSNSIIKRYTATASLMSIQNYEDQGQLSLCIEQGCEYKLDLRLSKSRLYSTLQVSIKYNGATNLNQIQIINWIIVYYEDKLHKIKLSNPLVIKDSGKIILNLNI